MTTDSEVAGTGDLVSPRAGTGDGGANCPITETQLLEIQRNFSWPVQAESFELRRAWRSRTGQFYLWIGSPGSLAVVVKHLPQVDAGIAERLYSTSSQFAEVLPEILSQRIASAPEPMGWLAHPPSLLLPWVDGVPLNQRIKTLQRQDPESHEYLSLVRRCGQALARLHESRAVDDQVVGAESPPNVVEALLRRPFSGELRKRIRLVESVGDFGLYNILCTPDQRLSVIDAPGKVRVVTVHRDLGRFIASLRGHSNGAMKRMGKSPEEVRARMRAALLAGYQTEATWTWHDSDDRFVDYYELYFDSQRIRRLLRHREYVSAMNLASPVLTRAIRLATGRFEPDSGSLEASGK